MTILLVNDPSVAAEKSYPAMFTPLRRGMLAEQLEPEPELVEPVGSATALVLGAGVLPEPPG